MIISQHRDQPRQINVLTLQLQPPQLAELFGQQLHLRLPHPRITQS